MRCALAPRVAPDIQAVIQLKIPRPPLLSANQRVKRFIKSRIGAGTWRPGDPVPSEAALMRQFGVARMTVNRALGELATEGLVRRVRGSGTFVAELHRISSRLSIRDIHEEVTERGHQPGTRMVLVAAERAAAATARALGLRVGARVFHTVLVHLESGVPIQYEDRHVNPAVAPGYLALDFSRVTPTRHLLSHAPLTEASYTIEACLPSPAEARLLAIGRAEPCLLMRRRTVSGAHVASVARLVYPGSRYSFSGNFQA